jgi:hypothetical protein
MHINEPWPMPDDSDIALFMDNLRTSETVLTEWPVVVPPDYTPTDGPEMPDPELDCLWWAPDDADYTAW